MFSSKHDYADDKGCTKLNVIDEPPMPIGQIGFFICWLVLAVLGGALLAYTWGLLAAKNEAQRAREEERLKQSHWPP